MNNLLAFITRYYHWMLFIVLEVISGVMLFRYNSYQGSLWVSSANAVTGKVYEWQSDVEQFFRLKERSAQLTRRNVELESQLDVLRRQLLQQKADTAAVDSAMEHALDELTMIPARVVSNSLTRPDNLMTIDCGSADGVEPDMCVVGGTGLVGVVYTCSSHYSVVLPLLNSRSRVSCAIRNRSYFGYLMWDGKNPTDAYIEDIPRHAQFEKGEVVETSGYSSIFPPGITVGHIVSIGNSADGLSYRLRIRLATDFGCLRDVFVVTDKNFAERSRLLNEARDSLSLTR